MKIDRTGSFLATEIDRALSTTAKQSLPQLVIKMQLVHWFDADKGDNGDWEDFSAYDMDTVGYFTLVFNGKQGPETSLSYDQLMKVYGWDGKDFQVLATMPAPDMFLVRVEDNDPDYADKTPYVVQWIDTKDADPRGGLKKLDAAGVKDLQAQFGALLNKFGKVAPPASAKKDAKAPSKAPPQAPSKATPVTPAAAPSEDVTNSAPPKQTAAQKKAAKAAKSKHVAEENARIEAEKAASLEAVFVPPTPPAPAVPASEDGEVVVDTKTKQEAYEYVFEMQAAGTTDEQRNAAWDAAIVKVAGASDKETQKTITGEQWYEVMHETLNVVGAV